MVLPNFLVIGAMKAGTTSLHNYLRSHPQVFMPRTKEPNFFTAEHNWSRGVAWYEQLFDEAGHAVARGEASIAYTLYPTFRGVPARISRVLPDVRLIYLVRDPIERMRSHYWEQAWDGHETDRSIDRALLEKPWYLDVSRYAMQIEQYLDYVPLEQILIVKSEELRERRASTLARILTFLGVDPHWVPEDLDREWNRRDEAQRKRRLDSLLRRIPAYGLLARLLPDPLKRFKRRLVIDKIGSAPIISSSAKRKLEDRLRDDVQRLRDYIGPDFDGWGIA